MARYDTPAQAQFINTYVPVPFEEILQAGMAKQQFYDVNRSAFEQQAAEAELLPAIPGSPDEAYIKNTVVATMRDLADDYSGKDYGDPEIVRELNNRVRAKIDRRLIQDIGLSAKAVQEYKQALTKLSMAGHPMPESLIPNFKLHNSRGGVFTGTPEAGLDWRDATKKFFDDVDYKSQGIYSIGNGMGVLRHARTLTDLQTHAKNNINVWLEDPANNQKVRDLRARGAKGSNEEIALQFLLPQAEEFVATRDSQPFKYGAGMPQFPLGGFSVESPKPAVEIEKIYTDYEDGTNQLKKLDAQILDLHNAIDNSKNPREAEAAKQQLKQAYDAQEKIINNYTWAEQEATETFADKEFNLLETFSIEDLPYVSSDSAFAGSPEFVKEMGKLKEEKSKYVQDLVDKYGNNSKTEMINSIPTTRIIQDESGQLYGETYNPNAGQSGKYVPSNFGGMLADILSDPDVNERMVKPVGNSDSNLKKFKKAGSYKIDGVSNPSDENGAYVTVTAFKDRIFSLDPSKKKSDNKIGTYDIYLTTPTQKQAVAEAYYMNGNLRDAFRWSMPEIEQTVQYNTLGGGVNSFDVPLGSIGTANVNKTDKGWIIEIDGRYSSPLSSPNDISNYLYQVVSLNMNNTQ